MAEHEEFHERVITSLATQKEMLENILTQTIKTNGRVTELEKKNADHEKIHAIDKDRKERFDWYKDKFGSAAIGIICAAIGFMALLVLQKAEIVDISVVAPGEYDRIANSLGE